MLLTSRRLLSILAAAVVSTTCTAPADNAPAKSANASSNADAAGPVAAAPTAAALLALEKRANEAYIEGDGAFFESILSDDLVMQEGGSRLGKADVVRMISGVECEVEEGGGLTGPRMTKIDDDTYVLSYESNLKGSCTAGGKTEQIPSPVRAATVWIRKGDRWRAAFHGENLVVDAGAPPATDSSEEAKTAAKAAANTRTAVAPAPAEPTPDPITDALMAAENSVWEAWRTHDSERIADLTAREIAFVNVFGTYFANKADVIRDWTGATCDVEKFALKDGVGTSVSPTVGILTLTGTIHGTCGGQDISGQEIHGTSVYVKDDGAWKWAFGFNSPS